MRRLTQDTTLLALELEEGDHEPRNAKYAALEVEKSKETNPPPPPEPLEEM